MFPINSSYDVSLLINLKKMEKQKEQNLKTAKCVLFLFEYKVMFSSLMIVSS